MGRYGAEMNKSTTSTTIGVGSVEAPAAAMRRIFLYDLIFGSEATPADNVFLFEVNRSTTAATGTAVTPNALDPGDPIAAVTLVKENLTVQGTNTAGAVPLSTPLNQRASFRWVAAPGGELVVVATALFGFHFNTPTAVGTPAASISANFNEP
jgi:hypothetical protein